MATQGTNLYFIVKEGLFAQVHELLGITSGTAETRKVFEYNIGDAVPTDLAVVRPSAQETIFFFSTTAGIFYNSGETTKPLSQTDTNNTREMDISFFGDTILVYATQMREGALHFVVYQLTRNP